MRLFQRIFLSFWIAMVFISVITGAVLSIAYSRPRPQILSLPLPQLDACAETLIRNGELNSPARASSAAGNSPCGTLYILDKSDHRGGAVPADVQSLANGVTLHIPLNMQVQPEKAMLAFAVPAGGSDMVAVAILPTAKWHPPHFLRWQLVVAAFVSMITCLLLTRHIVDPIRKLQSTTDAFGRGNLDSRPAPSLLGRKDELGELSNTIAEMSTRISVLMSSQRHFLVQVSHELGSPLTRLKIALALARRKAEPVLLPELDRIQRESSELNSMIQQLLKLARLESGLEEEDQETYSLDLVMEEVCADAQFTAEEMGKHVHLLSATEAAVHGHRELLKRALDNVLRNAIRFTPESGHVNIDVRRESKKICVIQVKDPGVGVPDEKLEAIFEPFVRVASSTDRVGAGLGLAIAKQGVLANGGTIRALNLEKGGLLIEIRLPLVSDGYAVAGSGVEAERHFAE